MREVGKRQDKAQRTADSVYGSILADILAGRLVSGTPLSELSLSRDLRVSRTPVHEAIRLLVNDGLVHQTTHHRAVVAALGKEDVQDLFDMRRLLESEAARRAASRMDRQTLTRLQATAEFLAAEPGASDWTERWASFDEDFHSSIARASGSPRLFQDIGRYRLLHKGLNRHATTADILQQALQEHVRILEALNQRNGDAAAKAMDEHISEWQRFFTNRISESSITTSRNVNVSA